MTTLRDAESDRIAGVCRCCRRRIRRLVPRMRRWRMFEAHVDDGHCIVARRFPLQHTYINYWLVLSSQILTWTAYWLDRA